jgi:hypothetical protein
MQWALLPTQDNYLQVIIFMLVVEVLGMVQAVLVAEPVQMALVQPIQAVAVAVVMALVVLKVLAVQA